MIAIAIAGGLLGWLLTRGSGDHKAAPSTVVTGQILPGIPAGAHVGPSTYTVDGLRGMRSALHQPIYWLGRQQGYTYELERTSRGNVFLSYLPPGVKSSGNRKAYVVVGTYPVKNAADGLRKVAEKTNAQISKLPGGGIALFGGNHPRSGYVAYPNADFEIEVYAPKLQQARKLILSGKLRPVG